MSTPDWKRLGFLTPDAPACQQEVWALFARQELRLATALEELALRTAEPSWSAALRDGAAASIALAETLSTEAGAAAAERVADDEAVAEFESAVDEVLASGHIPSLLVTGYGPLGELAALPARLLADVAGPWGAALAARVAHHDAHRPLARLFALTTPAPREADSLRRLLRHVNERLAGIHATWRQTFHVLGVDGEVLAEEGRTTARSVAHELGLKVTARDLGVFRG